MPFGIMKRILIRPSTSKIKNISDLIEHTHLKNGYINGKKTENEAQYLFEFNFDKADKKGDIFESTNLKGTICKNAANEDECLNINNISQINPSNINKEINIAHGFEIKHYSSKKMQEYQILNGEELILERVSSKMTLPKPFTVKNELNETLEAQSGIIFFHNKSYYSQYFLDSFFLHPQGEIFETEGELNMPSLHREFEKISAQKAYFQHSNESNNMVLDGQVHLQSFDKINLTKRADVFADKAFVNDLKKEVLLNKNVKIIEYDPQTQRPKSTIVANEAFYNLTTGQIRLQKDVKLQDELGGKSSELEGLTYNTKTQSGEVIQTPEETGKRAKVKLTI